MKKITILLYTLIIINSSFSLDYKSTHKIPQSELNNESIKNIPPVKIEGYTLGMLKNNFLNKLYKNFEKKLVTIITLRKKNPGVLVYKVNTGTTLNYSFFIYGNMLAKIYLVKIRPFNTAEKLLRRHKYKYGYPYNKWKGRTRRFSRLGYRWEKYFWKSYYRYRPGFSRLILDMNVVITLDFSIRHRLVRRVIYGYAFHNDFLNKHFGVFLDY